MLRQAPRYFLRHNAPILRSLPQRRLISTAPPSQKSRSWKSSTVRWGLAAGLVYWYSTSNLFAEEAAFPIASPPSPSEETTLPTLETIRPTHRKDKSDLISSQSSSPAPNAPSSPNSQLAPETTASAALEDTEEEASQEGAFNEETGEINWDCPCLGGMAHGPCGEQFRAAFSCFVHSKEEPKGMDCIDNFKNMQECFREHPDIYGGELEEDDGEEENPERDGASATGGALARTDASSAVGHAEPSTTSQTPSKGHAPSSAGSGLSASGSKAESSVPPSKDEVTYRAKAAKEQVQKENGDLTSESDQLVPKAAHDAT